MISASVLSTQPLATEIEDVWLGALGHTALAWNTLVHHMRVPAALQLNLPREGLAAVLSGGERAALYTYTTIHDLFGAAADYLAGLFAPSPAPIRLPTPHITPPSVAVVPPSSPGSSGSPPSAPTSQTYSRYITNNTTNVVSGGVT